MKKVIGYLAFGFLLAGTGIAHAEPDSNATASVENVLRVGVTCSTLAVTSTAVELTGNVNVSSATAGVKSIYIKNLSTTETLYHWPGSGVSAAIGDPITPQPSSTSEYNWAARAISPRRPYYLLSSSGSSSKAIVCLTK